MVDRRMVRRARWGMGVSAVALVSAGQAMAQTQPPCVPNDSGYCVISNDGETGTVTLASPAQLINRGTVSGTEGVTFAGVPLPLPATATLGMGIIDNRAGGTITGTGGTAIRGSLPLTVINAGTINGNVTGAQFYVANGGTLNGNLVLGPTNPNDLGSQYFVQRGDRTGVTGTITAGGGIDFWVRSYAASASVTLGAPLPTSFEVEGVEARGSGTTVTIAAPSADPVRGLMLMGDGNIVNRANVSLFNTVGAGYPVNVQLFTPAIGYAGVPETNAAFYFRFPNPAVPTQNLASYALPVFGALTSFTNEGIVTGDIRLSTAGFINTGTINLQTRATGTLILTAKDQDFVFRNTGTVNYTDTGARAALSQTENLYLGDGGSTYALRLYQPLSDVAKDAVFENSGQITGGLYARMVARNFTFTNTGRIAGIETANANANGLRFLIGKDLLDDDTAGEVAADRFSFLNHTTGNITQGVAVDAIATNLIFENRGTINRGATSTRVINVEQYGLTDANDNEVDNATFSFINSGITRGDIVLESNSLKTSVLNDRGAMLMAAENIGFQPFFTGFETLEVDVATRGANVVDFTNTGVISQSNRGAKAVSLEIASEAASTVNIVNSGEIRADNGTLRTSGSFFGQPGRQQFQSSVGLYVGVDAPTADVRIENQQGGLISAFGGLFIQTPTATTLSPTFPNGYASIALLLDTDAGAKTQIVNAGTIQGGSTLTFSPDVFSFNLQWQIEDNRFGGAITGGAGSETLINTATGVIRGGIVLGAGDDRIENYGQILGYTYLGSGNDTYLHLLRNAQFSGVDGGAGEDTLIFDITGSDGVVSDALLSSFINFEIRKLTGTGNVVTNSEVTVEDGSTLNLGAGTVITTPGQTAVGGGEGSEAVSNAGTIVGNVDLGNGNNAFANSGSVTGNFTSGTGGDQFANAGTFTGNVSTGDGGDEFTNTGTFTGNVDLGLGGDKYVIGNAVQGIVDGGEGFDEAVFNLGARPTPPAQPAAPATGLAGARTALGIARDALAGGIDNGAAIVSLDGNEMTAGGAVDVLDLGAFQILDSAEPVAQAAGDPILLTPAVVGNLVNFELLSVNGPGTVNASGAFTVGTIGLNGADLIVTAGNTLSTTGATTLTGSAGSETVTVAGTVAGGISLGGGVDTLNVTGRVAGAIDLGDGVDTLNIGSGASFGGAVSGGAGVDTIAVNTNGTASAPYVIAGGGFTGFELFVNAGGATAITGALNLGATGLFAVNGGSLFARTGAVLTGNVAVSAGASFGNAGTLDGALAFDNGGHTFANSGTITGGVTGGSGNDTITNTGVMLGNVALGAGADTLNANGRFGGTIDLGDGNDTLNIGIGALFSGNVVGGAGSDGIVVAAGGSEASPFELIGNFSGFESYAQTNGVTAVTGILNLGTTGSFTLTGGRLFGRAGSALTGSVAVGSGATFGSAGTVNGNIAVASGGTLSPGASPGIMTVNGNVSLAGGSTTVFEFVPAPGQSDQLNINGALTIASGATLNMTGNRPLTPGVTYNMITATGGITGTFTTVNKASSVLGFLRYTATQLQLLGTFQVPADASVQTGAAINYLNSVLIAGTASQSLINAIPSLLTTAGTANTVLFGQLTPEAYATASQLSVEHGLTLSKTFRSGIATPASSENGVFMFGQGVGNWRDLDGNAALGTSAATSETYGFVAGMGYGSADASIGLFAGKLDSKQTIWGLGARTDADGIVAGFAARLASGGLELNLLAAYDGSTADTSRGVPGGTVRSRYDLHALVLDMSLGYAMPIGSNWALRPQAGVTMVATDRKGAVESGSATFGYTIAGNDPTATFVDGSLTLKGGLDPAATLRPWVQVGVRHQVSGDILSASGGFAGAGRFTVLGASRGETQGTAGAGISAELGGGFSVGAAYQGEFGKTQSHNATVGFRFDF